MSHTEQSAPTTIRPLGIAELRELGAALFEAHWQEIARHKAVMVLRPHWDAYEQAEAAGMLLCLGAFAGEQLVGYSVSTVLQHLHYADLVYAQNDVLFVARPHRAGRVGLRLIEETERQARERGAQLVTWNAKQATKLAELLPRLGYGVEDIVFSKELR